MAVSVSADCERSVLSQIWTVSFFVVVFFFVFFFDLQKLEDLWNFFFACPAMPAVTNAFSYCAISL